MSTLQSIKPAFRNTLRRNVSLSEFTSLGIGGKAKYFLRTPDQDTLKKALIFTNQSQTPFALIAGGSNVLVSDQGFNGLIIKHEAQGMLFENDVARVESGTSLSTLVKSLISKRLGGMEKLIGIPGSVGGALYGNAGAFGQTISDVLLSVKVFDGKKEYWLTRQQCKFEYRHSRFQKERGLVILEAKFAPVRSSVDNLKKAVRHVLEIRKRKYPSGIKCPGSFFKNLLTSDLPENLQTIVPKDYFGKVPAGWFLEQVGAKGAREGGIKIANYHANLFINAKSGTANDFLKLAGLFKNKVKAKFDIDLEYEVQLIGFGANTLKMI